MFSGTTEVTLSILDLPVHQIEGILSVKHECAEWKGNRCHHRHQHIC